MTTSKAVTRADKTFQDHQKSIITFLSKRCPQQTGIILYHHMGTGKSFTSTSVALNWGLDIVLLAPEMLIAQWQQDYFNRYKDTLPKVCHKESYESVWALLDKHDEKTEEGKKWYASKTLLMDECHNIADWMNNRIDIDKRARYMKRLMSFGRRVLLTGTPMYWSARDLAFQVNIAAGRAVMPVDAVAFERKFFLTNYFKSAANGWIRPLHNILQRISSVIQSLILRMSMVSMKIGIIGIYMQLRNSNTPTKQDGANFCKSISNYFILPFQLVTNFLVRIIEGIYIGALTVPLTFLTKKMYKLVLQKDYDNLMGGIQKLTNAKITEKINLNAFQGFYENPPINEPETFNTLMWFINAIQQYIKSGVDMDKELIINEIDSESTLDEQSQYHGKKFLAILKNSPRPLQSKIDKAIEEFKVSAATDFRDPKTHLKLAQLRNLLYEAGGKRHVQYFVDSVVKSINRQVQVFLWQIQYILVLVSISIGLYVSSKLFRDQHSLRYINTTLFEREVAPYISYYKPTEASSVEGGWLQWLSKTFKGRAPKPATRKRNNLVFPKVTQHEERVAYTETQTDLYLRYTMGKMDYDDYAALQLIASPDKEEAALESFDQTSQDNYERYGCYIGNICTFASTSATARHPYHKSHVVWKSKADELHWVLARGSSFAEVSPKFKAIEARIKQHQAFVGKGRQCQRHCLYSNYGFASSSLCAYLIDAFRNDPNVQVRFITNESTKQKHEQIKAWYYSDDAETGKTKLLFLDTSYTEGLSILKTDVMHILDPCQSIAKEEQLKARVARLDSHKAGDELHIYEYMSHCPRFQKAFRSVLGWSKLRSEYFYGAMPLNFTQKLTPDYVVKHRLKNMNDLITKLSNKLRDTAVERYADERTPLPKRCTQSNKCNISTPGSSKEYHNANACWLVNRNRVKSHTRKSLMRQP